MIVVLEIIVGIVLFTLIVVPMTAKDPLGAIGDYPPAIRRRCVELGLVEDREEKRFSVSELIRKVLAVLVLVAVLAFILVKVNHAGTFLQGFGISYLIWLAITWFDALVLDCGWFCHTQKVRIPGTEDMPEYQDYWFHIKQSCIGTLLGLPACALIGLAVMLIAK